MTACHLAQKYSDTVELLLIDRSMDELFGIADQKLRSTSLTSTFGQFTRDWECKNSVNFLKSKCFKIITCDPLDDTVGLPVSTMAGVAQNFASHKYTGIEYRKWFESLKFVIDLEQE